MFKSRLTLFFARAAGFTPAKVKLRFDVNQAEAFRHGVDCPHSTVTLKIDPANLTDNQRQLLMDRLIGIDVCEGFLRNDGSRGPSTLHQARTDASRLAKPVPCRLVASLPTLASLVEALEKDERKLAEQFLLRNARIAVVHFQPANRHSSLSPTHTARNIVPLADDSVEARTFPSAARLPVEV